MRFINIAETIEQAFSIQCYQTGYERVGDLAYSYVIVYMDDILIAAQSKDVALERVQIVLETLTKAWFSFNIGKCFFLKTTVEVEGEIRPNSRKIESLRDLPPPKSVFTLRQFIALASYFRQFVPGFSELMKPLYFLTSDKCSFKWKLEHEEIRKIDSNSWPFLIHSTQ